jgi:hypothetical protein
MAKHSSASPRTETPHSSKDNTLNNPDSSKSNNPDNQHQSTNRRQMRKRSPRRPLSDDVKQRALAIINNMTIDASIRGAIRYVFEINDPCTPDLVRRVEAGEYILDNLRPGKPQRR